MSPTLAMICERDANISVFKPEPFYTVHLACNGFSLIGEKLKDKGQATAVLRTCDGQSATIESVEQKEKTEKPPKLYDLTTLQREANKLLGFTAEQTLQYAQCLYEKKYITYPRTDSRFLTEDMESSIPILAQAMVGFFIPKTDELTINTAQVVDNSKVTDHHAIIPTMNIKGIDVQGLPHGERETLLLIAIRLLVSVGDIHRYHEQLMIYAQRPDATACAEYGLWNEKMNRYVRRGSKGIALIDTASETPKIKYVFDVSDTGGRENSRRPFLWEMKDRHEQPILEMLQDKFGASGNHLTDTFYNIANDLAKEYYDNHRGDIRYLTEDSFLAASLTNGQRWRKLFVD